MGEKRVLDLGRFNFPWHDYMIGAIGNVVLLVAGYAGSLAIGVPAAGNRSARPSTKAASSPLT
jgi:hypothetical protein